MTYHSHHGGLWIDRSDFKNVLNEKLKHGYLTSFEAEQLTFFETEGYIIIEDAVDERSIDGLNDFVEELWNARPADVLVQNGYGQYKNIGEVTERQPLVKMLDLYCLTEHARNLSFSKKIARFMGFLFGEEPLAFQSLTFQVGSTQACHKDGAYVVTDRPLEFAASWIALEDIKTGSGELQYYPRSHRFKDEDFGEGRMHWNPELDGQEVHDKYLSDIHKNAEAEGIKLETFRPKKGSALIWHPGLAHGGSQIEDENLTRRSHVTHYCPLSNTPNYFKFAPMYSGIKKSPLGNYSSWFYNLSNEL